jgi:hypothetical protein
MVPTIKRPKGSIHRWSALTLAPAPSLWMLLKIELDVLQKMAKPFELALDPAHFVGKIHYR